MNVSIAIAILPAFPLATVGTEDDTARLPQPYHPSRVMPGKDPDVKPGIELSPVSMSRAARRTSAVTA